MNTLRTAIFIAALGAIQTVEISAMDSLTLENQSGTSSLWAIKSDILRRSQLNARTSPTASPTNGAKRSMDLTNSSTALRAESAKLQRLNDLIKNGGSIADIRVAIGNCKSVNGEADPDANTVLHAAALAGKVVVCTLLLEKGASKNASNQAGITPEGIAEASSNNELKELFRSYPA